MSIPDGSPIKATIGKSADKVEVALTDVVDSVQKVDEAVETADVTAESVVTETAERTGMSADEVRRLIADELDARAAQPDPTAPAEPGDPTSVVETESRDATVVAAPTETAEAEREPPESASPGKTRKRGKRRVRDEAPSTGGSLAARFFRGR